MTIGFDPKSMEPASKEKALIAAIDALAPNERQRKAELFRKALPAIVAAEDRGVPRSKIINALKEQGLVLSVGGYSALREKAEKAEKEREPADGNNSHQA